MFEAWLADLRVDDAVHARARTAWLGRQAAEEATLAGVLADLAERERAVLVDTLAGRRHRGQLLVIGEDFCAVRTSHGVVVLLRYDAVAGVRPAAKELGPTGNRVIAPTARLAGALSALAGRGTRVIAYAGTGAPVRGELVAVGVDVVTLRLDDRGACYVPLTSLGEVSVVESG